MSNGPSSNPANSGHGHVRKRPDGVTARCGGPGLCPECSRELAIANGQIPEVQLTTMSQMAIGLNEMYNALIASGFSEGDAIKLTSDYLCATAVRGANGQ